MDADRQRKWDALDQVRVAKNCPASWRQMHGDDRVRHCTHCDRNVYNLSNMTRDEAADLIERTEGRLCVRFYQRSDGMLMTRDCGRAVRAKWRLYTVLASVLGLFGFVMAPPFLTATTGVLRIPPERMIKVYEKRLATAKESLADAKTWEERSTLKDELAFYQEQIHKFRADIASKAKEPQR